MDSPFFSIVVPVYNARETLPALIRSIAGQSDPSFEVLFADDGSDDRPDELVSAVNDPRFRFLPGPHSGCAAAPRNRGLRAASGKYLLFADADDELLPEGLASLRAGILRSGNPDVLFGSFETARMENGMLRTSPVRSSVLPESAGVMSGRSVLEFLAKNGRPLACNGYIATYRTEFLRKNDLFQREDLTLSEDHEWLPRVLFAAESAAGCSAVHYRYIRRPGSITTAFGVRALASAGTAARLLRDFRSGHWKEMSPLCRRFWSDHAATPFLWYYFHPMYRAKIKPAEWKDALKKSGLFTPFSSGFRTLAMFSGGGPAKKAALPFLFFLCFGIDFPARCWFRLRFGGNSGT